MSLVFRPGAWDEILTVLAVPRQYFTGGHHYIGPPLLNEPWRRGVMATSLPKRRRRLRARCQRILRRHPR